MAVAGRTAWTRRRFLQAAAVPTLFPALSRCAEIDSPAVLVEPKEGLRELAGARGLRYGAAVQARQLSPWNDSASVFAAECSSLTPELAMKWTRLAPAGNSYDFSDMDRIARFARDNKMTLRGHTLLWHRSVPAWAAALIARTRQWHHVRDHMEKVMARYGAQIDQWDVVNEPIEIGSRDDDLRDSIFLQAYGPDYIDWAFWSAHDFAPHSDRFINEYGLEYATVEDGRRRLALLRLLEGMRSRDVPVTGLGIQAHLDLRKGRLDHNGIYGLLRDATGLGLKIAITELDVREADTSMPLAMRDGRVADETRRYLDLVLQFPSVVSVGTWGLGNGTSWLRYGEDAQPRNRGLPYDERWRPTPMRRAIARAFGEQALI